MTMSERIQQRLRAMGMNISQLARAVEISPQAMRKIVNGDTANTARIYQIAKALKTSPEYLACETDDAAPRPELNDSRRGLETIPGELGNASDNKDIIAVHEIDLSLGMGMTYLDVPIKEKVRWFDRQWLRDYTGVSPAKLFCAQGIGNSMAPYIESNDLLFIDTAQDTVRMSEQVWAITYGNCGAVKRLFPMADGSVKMRSDNPAVSDEIAYDGELQVIGRVVAIMRKI